MPHYDILFSLVNNITTSRMHVRFYMTGIDTYV